MSTLQLDLSSTQALLRTKKRAKVENVLDEERKDIASKIKLLHEEGQRRQEANDNHKMFELQILEMKKACLHRQMMITI